MSVNLYRDDKLRAAMAAQKLTQQDVAEKSGIHRSTVGLIVEGKVDNFQAQTLRAIADALGVEWRELFEFEVEPVAA